MKFKKLAANTVSSLVFQICAIICGFIVPRLILKCYGSEVNGLVNSITQFLGVITFLEFGIGSVIQSALYKPLADKDNDKISEIAVSGQKFFSRLSIILLIYVIVLMVVYPFIAVQDYSFIYTTALIIAISISSFAQYYFGIINKLLLISDQKGYITYNIQTITLILNTLACFVLINIGASIHFVKLVTSLVYVIRPVYMYVYVSKHYKINRKIKYQTEPIQQKWNGVAQHVSSFVLDGTDNIVITIFLGLKAVSVYSVYNLVISSIKQLLLSMTNGIKSLLGELWAKDETDELYNIFGWTEWSIHTGTTFVFGVTSVLIVPFVQVFTDGISDVNYIQPLFAALIVAANAGHCFRLPYNLMILAAGHYKQTQSNYIITAIINIIISIIAVNICGLIGVVVGTVIAMFYQTVWMAWYNSKNLIKWPFKNFLKQLLVDMITVILLHFITKVSLIEEVFLLKNINYVAWLILAVKVSVVMLIVILILNYIFYFRYITTMLHNIRYRG